MKRTIAVVIALISSTAFAQEPAVIYGQFGFQPKDWSSAQLTETQKKDLESCTSVAKQAGGPKEDRAALDSLYGFKPGQADMYGAVLSGCLADEKDGKGWVALKRSGQAWEPVTGRYALRSFIGMDPTK